MRIYIIGFMGAGKSTYAKKLANKLKLDLVDLDELIELKAGKSITKIFDEEGEMYFRELESEVLKSTAEQDNMVVATGGGTPCYYDNLAFMKANGKTIYIKLLENKLFNRLWKAKGERPLIADMEEAELKLFINEKLTERSQFYCQADYIIHPDFYLAKNMAERLQEDMNEAG